ncbi:hypothetical protein MKEN_00898800 [Mycena kentingensis (nom. inval.)]|nr:hypothetical protein MKEN_00898800 [Mycena kentingensis (nom. inval.)]
MELSHNTGCLLSTPTMSSTLSMLRKDTARRNGRARTNENLPSSPTPLAPNNTAISSGASTPGTSTPGAGAFNFETEWEREIYPGGHFSSSGLAPAPKTVAERVAYGERLQKKMKIDESNMPLVREFWETTNPEEREIFMLMMSVSNHNEATHLAIQAAKVWKPSAEQLATIRTYTKLLVLLPELHYFNGALEHAVVKTLLSQPGHGLPADTNEAAHDLLLATVARQVSLTLSQLKKMILESIVDPKHPERPAIHIHELAEDILRTFPSKLKFKLSHSLAFYHHIAFIRSHVRKMYPQRQHWEKVDEDKEDILTNGTPEEQVEALQMIYLLDIETFPAAENARTYALSTDIFGGNPKPWHRTLVKHAKAVTRIAAGSASRKRKLTHMMDEVDEEQDEEPHEEDDLDLPVPPSSVSGNLNTEDEE